MASLRVMPDSPIRVFPAGQGALTSPVGAGNEVGTGPEAGTGSRCQAFAVLVAVPGTSVVARVRRHRARGEPAVTAPSRCSPAHRHHVGAAAHLGGRPDRAVRHRRGVAVQAVGGPARLVADQSATLRAPRSTSRWGCWSAWRSAWAPRCCWRPWTPGSAERRATCPRSPSAPTSSACWPARRPPTLPSVTALIVRDRQHQLAGRGERDQRGQRGQRDQRRRQRARRKPGPADTRSRRAQRPGTAQRPGRPEPDWVQHLNHPADDPVDRPAQRTVHRLQQRQLQRLNPRRPSTRGCGGATRSPRTATRAVHRRGAPFELSDRDDRRATAGPESPLRSLAPTARRTEHQRGPWTGAGSPLPPNPSELLGSRQMRAALESSNGSPWSSSTRRRCCR